MKAEAEKNRSSISCRFSFPVHIYKEKRKVNLKQHYTKHMLQNRRNIKMTVTDKHHPRKEKQTFTQAEIENPS